MAKQLTEYHCVQACRSMTDPNTIRIVKQFQIVLDGPCPTDTFNYNHHRDLTHVSLWGTNPEQLRKMARYLLLS